MTVNWKISYFIIIIRTRQTDWKSPSHSLSPQLHCSLTGSMTDWLTAWVAIPNRSLGDKRQPTTNQLTQQNNRHREPKIDELIALLLLNCHWKEEDEVQNGKYNHKKGPRECGRRYCVCLRMRHVAHRPWSCAPEKKVSIKIINKALVFISFWVAHFRDANGWLPACLLLLVCCCWLERWFVCTVCLSILDRLSKAIRLNLLRLLLLRFLSTRGRYILECSTFALLFSSIYHIILRMHSPWPPQMVTRAPEQLSSSSTTQHKYNWQTSH